MYVVKCLFSQCVNQGQLRKTYYLLFSTREYTVTATGVLSSISNCNVFFFYCKAQSKYEWKNDTMHKKLLLYFLVSRIQLVLVIIFFLWSNHISKHFLSSNVAFKTRIVWHLWEHEIVISGEILDLKPGITITTCDGISRDKF